VQQDIRDDPARGVAAEISNSRTTPARGARLV